MRRRTRDFLLFLGAVSVELLVALAWWWHPEHAVVWAVAAGWIIVIVAIVDRGLRR